jgi:tetratricopeptide (TPR) repeat protein
MGRDIFVSYRHEDQAVAARVCAALEQHGVSCWMAPRDIQPAEEWAAGIVERIRQCHTFVLILSENCQRSRHIARELELADSHALRIVALRIQDIQPPPQLQFFLGNVQWLDAFGDKFDLAMTRLTEAMRRSDSHPAPLTRIDPRTHELIATTAKKARMKRGPWCTKVIAKLAAGLLLAAGIGTGAYLKVKQIEAYDLYQKGEKFYQIGDLKHALRAYSGAIAADNNFYNAYCERARVYEASGDRRNALADLRTAIQLDPDRVFAKKLRDEFSR